MIDIDNLDDKRYKSATETSEAPIEETGTHAIGSRGEEGRGSRAA